MLRRAAAHQGAAFVEIFQNCNIYNDGAFDFVRDEKENRLYLEHGQPAGDTGITHDETDFATAFALSRVTYATHGVVPLGVFRDVERDELRRTRAGAARQRNGRRRPAGARRLRRHLVDQLSRHGERLRGLALARDAHDLPGEPELLEPGDHPAAGIEGGLEARIPWNADVGNAWWLLCHDSPNEIRLNSQTLRLSSDELEVAAGPRSGRSS